MLAATNHPVRRGCWGPARGCRVGRAAEPHPRTTNEHSRRPPFHPFGRGWLGNAGCVVRVALCAGTGGVGGRRAEGRAHDVWESAYCVDLSPPPDGGGVVFLRFRRFTRPLLAPLRAVFLCPSGVRPRVGRARTVQGLRGRGVPAIVPPKLPATPAYCCGWCALYWASGGVALPLLCACTQCVVYALQNPCDGHFQPDMPRRCTGFT